MNGSGISRRALFARLFGGTALTVGGSVAGAQVTGIEKPAPNARVGTVSYTFDAEGRLLSVTHDDATQDVATASFV